MNALERHAIERLVNQAHELGVADQVPAAIHAFLDRDAGWSWAASRWIELNPDNPDPSPGCCDNSVYRGPENCSCWTPVFDVEQAEPRFPACAEDLKVRADRCDDCAFRKGSPEMQDVWMREALIEQTDAGKAFYCHDGMRRPLRYEHPDGRAVEGSTADWRPLIDALGIPYRADGQPGLLCAGWANRRIRTSA